VNNSPDRAVRHIWVFAQYGGLLDPVFEHCPNSKNVLFGQFRERAGISFAGLRNIASPRLGYTVSHVFRMCSANKMFWVHARRIVAFVKNNLPINVIARNHAGNAMSQERSVIIGDDAVSLAIERPSPWPTFVGRKARSLRPEVAFEVAKGLNPSRLFKSRSTGFAYSRVSLFHELDNSTLGLCAEGISA
jgi:hypothetical protein